MTRAGTHCVFRYGRVDSKRTMASRQFLLDRQGGILQIEY